MDNDFTESYRKFSSLLIQIEIMNKLIATAMLTFAVMGATTTTTTATPTVNESGCAANIGSVIKGAGNLISAFAKASDHCASSTKTAKCAADIS